MPLSKARDRKRKQLTRRKIRLDAEKHTALSNLTAKKSIDADGNPVPDYY